MMDWQLVAICLLTGVINLIGALAYAARIAGVRTGRIALSFALFNLLVLVSRTANGFLAPFIAKRIETALLVQDAGTALLWDLRVVLFSAAVAVALGIVLVPTFQRLFARAITYFQHNRSTTRLLLRSATPAGLRTIRDSVAIPSAETVRSLGKPKGVGNHQRGGHDPAVRPDRPADLRHDRRCDGWQHQRNGVPPHARVDFAQPPCRDPAGPGAAGARRNPDRRGLALHLNGPPVMLLTPVSPGGDDGLQAGRRRQP